MSSTANAYGNFLSNPPPFLSNYAAIASPWGTLVKPGGRVAAYLRSTGAQDGEDHFAASGLLVTTLSAALKRCRSGYNDIVYVLPGDVQSISAADFASDLVAGTQIISCGRPGGTNNPTWTWSAVTSTFLLDVADCSLVGLNLVFGGADNVTAPITVSAAGCSIVGNHITMGTSASLECATALTLASGATDCWVMGNRMTATGGAVTTAAISVGAVARPVIVNNRIITTQSSATTGVIAITAAATDVDVGWNRMYNTLEDGIGIRLADVAATGIIYNNYFGGVDAGGTVANTVKCVSFAGTSHIVRCFENRALDEDSATGVISPAAATT
jgi:hypothetical protein